MAAKQENDEENNHDGFESNESKLRWKKQKKLEYQFDEYDPNNMNDWRNMPLFSNVLNAENPASAAILAMQKKEKPRHRAKEFKTSGNRAYQLGATRYHDAIAYYTQALAVQCSDHTLNSTIYANRAQVNLCLKNYGKVMADCTQAIELQTHTYKAYWRAAMAARALEKYADAIQWCDDGMNVMRALMLKDASSSNLDKHDTSSSSSSDDEDDKDDAKKNAKSSTKTEHERLQEQSMKLEQLRQKCVSQQQKLQLKKESEAKQKQAKANAQKARLQALQTRGITIGETDTYNVRESYAMQHRIAYDAKMDALHFAVLFMYPEYEQSDFIRAFGENERFADHLKQMFAPLAESPSWDKKGKYLAHRLCVYYETSDRFVHVNVNKSLKEILQRTDYVVPVLPVFFVLCRDSAFTAEFVKRKCDALV